MDKLKEFFNEASNHEGIKQELSGHKDSDSFCQQVVESGEKLGYNFSKEEVKNVLFKPDNRELSNAELSLSTGGGDAFSEALHTVDAGIFGAADDWLLRQNDPC